MTSADRFSTVTESFAITSCLVCTRFGGDGSRTRCIFCPDDAGIPKFICIACGKKPGSMGYQLCTDCYRNHARARYHLPRRGYPARIRSVPMVEGRMPDSPTHARPGTPEKLAVIAERVRLRQDTSHPDDAESKPVDLIEAYLQMARSTIAGVVRQDNGRVIRWRAYPWHSASRRHIHLGIFDTEEEAIRTVRRWQAEQKMQKEVDTDE